MTDDRPQLPFARGSRTSKGAAVSKRAAAASDRDRVTDYIWRQGGNGATADEIWEALGSEQATSNWSARVAELAGKWGRIRLAGRQRPTRKGRPAEVYVSVPRSDWPAEPAREIPRPSAAKLKLAAQQIEAVCTYWDAQGGYPCTELREVEKWLRGRAT